MSRHFKIGSGCYTCSCCNRLTRETDKSAAFHKQCAQCWELNGIENEISDHGETPELLAREAVLKAEIKAKGGKIS